MSLSLFYQGYCSVSNILSTNLRGDAHRISSTTLETAETHQTLGQTTLLNYTQRQDTPVGIDSSNGRVMLIDGTSVIYRAYYKLIGMFIYPS